MLKAREVICPFCEHMFMYLNADEIWFNKYSVKGSSEILTETKCPKCLEKVLIKDGELKGKSIMDYDVEERPEKFI